jgi:putative endonuclease
VSTRKGHVKGRQSAPGLGPDGIDTSDGRPAASSPLSRSNRGAQAEQFAARFLQQRGLSLLHRNYRCRHGEIDLILQDGATLVFVEVRLRSRSDFGGASASIDRHKQQRLTLAAHHYLATLPRTPPCRFDAVLLQEPDGTGVEWVRNAFET